MDDRELLIISLLVFWYLIYVQCTYTIYFNIIVSGHETLKQRRAHIKEFEGEIWINSVILFWVIYPIIEIKIVEKIF